MPVQVAEALSPPVVVPPPNVGPPLSSSSITGPSYDKGGAIYNIKAYGAMLDGSTDDRAAFATAVSAASADGGGIVFIPAGTLFTTYSPVRGNVGTGATAEYVCLMLPSNVYLQGAGIGATIWKFLDYPGSSSCCVGVATGVTNASVRGITFDGQHHTTAEVAHFGVELGGVVDVDVSLCEFRNLGSKGVMMPTSDAAVRVRIHGNDINHTAGNAIGPNYATGLEINENWIHDTDAITGAESIIGNRLAQFAIVGNNIDQAGSISIGTSTDGSIADNYVRPAAANPVLYCVAFGGSGSARVTVRNNVLDGTSVTRAAVGIDGGGGATDCAIEGNTLTAPGGQYGVVVGSTVPTNLAIRNNRIVGGAYSVYAPNTAGVIVQDNVVDQSIFVGTAGIVTGNQVGAGEILLNGADFTCANNCLLAGDIVVYAGPGVVAGNVITRTGTPLFISAGSGIVAVGNVITRTAAGDVILDHGSANLFVNNVLTGTASPATVTVPVSDVFRGNLGYNPVGVVSPAVPATGVAVAAVAYDRTFYVTANAGGGATMTIQNGPAVVIPASAVVAVRVPAGQTVTPTYTSAPTWVVEGE